jgi:putative PEP-CTERM system TPR-repeat lipoprotein
LTASLLLACAALAACGGGQSLESLLASARQYLAQNDPKAAEIQLKNALQKNPDSAEARFLLGKALLAAENPTAASVELRKAVALKYSPESVVPALAKAMLQQGEAKKLDDYADTKLGTPAAAADLKTTLAASYLMRGQPEQAAAAVDAALQAIPDYAPALVLRARMLASRRENAAALALLDKVIQKNPANVEAWVFKGDLLAYGHGDGEAAIEAYRKALELRKDDLAAHAGIVSIELGRNDLKAAKEQIEALRKVRPNHPQTRFLDAQLAFQQRDYKAAKEDVDQLLKINPENARVLQLAGALAYQSGSMREAEQLLGKALQAAPGLPYARGLLAQTYLQGGQADKALSTITPLLQAEKPSAEILSLAAAVYLRNGDSKKAEELFDRAIAANPKDMKARTALALTHLYKDNESGAIGELESIADSDTGTTADLALVNANLRRSNVAGALKAIDRLEKKQPDKPLAPSLRGRVLLATGDMQGARRNFDRALAADANFFPAVQGLALLDLRENNPSAAEQRFEKAAGRQPASVQPLLALAELRVRTGKAKETIVPLLTKAAKVRPNDATARLMLVDYLLQVQDYKPALDAAQDALAALPSDPRIQDALARSQLAVGDFNQALSSYGKLVAAYPKLERPLIGLSDAYVAAGKREEALDALKRATVVAPQSLLARQKAIALHVAAGRTGDAVAVARTVQSQWPTQAIGFLYEGDIEAVAKDWGAAAVAYRTGLQKQPSTALAEKLHGALVAAGKRRDADGLSAQWMKDHPKDALFAFYLGNQALAEQSYDTAEGRFRQVVDLQADNAPALNNLAWTLLKLKKPGAAAYAERANRLQPEQAAFLDTWAMTLAEDNKLDKAIDVQRKAVALQPQNSGLRLTLARLYVQSGDKALARKELEQLAQLGDKFPEQREVQRLREQL